MNSVRSEVLDWFAAHRVVPGKEVATLRAAHMLPAPAQWRIFLGQLALWLGMIALATAVIFFFAFNWQDIGRLAKFGLVEGLIVVSLLVYWWLDIDSMPAKALLTFLSLLVGALLALAGQIYQTGADTYELFAYWALLILPWVLASRFIPLWLILLSLLNLAVIQYFSLGRQDELVLWGPFLLNALGLIAWEAAHRFRMAWVADDWPPRVIAVASAAAATCLIMWAIFDGKGASGALAALAYVAWIAGIYAWYRRVRPDLLMLAAGMLSVIIAVAAFLSERMFSSGSEGSAFLFIGIIVIAMSAGGAMWLRAIAKEQAA